MLHSKLFKLLTVMLLTLGFFSACKKDAFSEKDAIAAQTTLLQTKFSYDLAIKQIDLQIQRSGDSAKIVIQNLVNSGATALEILKQQNVLAQILQNQNNYLAQLRYADSLTRNAAVLTDKLAAARKAFNDSVTTAVNNASLRLQLQHNYAITVTDVNGNTPIANATVSVLQYGSTTLTTATTNSSGVAKFDGIIVDPAASFIVSAPSYGSALVQENNLAVLGSALQTAGGLSVTTSSKSGTVQLYNSSTNRNTVAGSILADLDLTNGDAAEGLSGQLITFVGNITLNGVSGLYQFSTLSDATGKYSINLPDGSFNTTYPNIKAQQRLFVNAWTDEDITAAVPRIDSTGTLLGASTFSTGISSGTALGYYFQFPNDLNNKTVVAANATSGTNSNNNPFNPYNYINFQNSQAPFANVANGGARMDSIAGGSQFINNWFFNNSNIVNTGESARYRVRANTAAQPLDTVPVKLISLVPGWIMKSPLLKIAIAPNGTVPTSIVINGLATNNGVALQRQDNSQWIQTVVVAGANPQTPLGPTNYPQGVQGVNYTPNPAYNLYKADAGGLFNPMAITTLTNRNAATNLPFATQVYSANNVLPTNATSFTVSGGRSYLLPMEYRNIISRDRSPR